MASYYGKFAREQIRAIAESDEVQTIEHDSIERGQTIISGAFLKLDMKPINTTLSMRPIMASKTKVVGQYSVHKEHGNTHIS